MRWTLTRLSLLTAVLATLAAAACAEIFGPSVALGTYQLTAVNGDPVPYIVDDTTFGDGTRHEGRIAADSIVFDFFGRIYRERREDIIHYRPDSTRDTIHYVGGSTGSFRGLSSDKVVITYDLGGVVRFPFSWPPETLTVENDRLRREATYYSPTPQVWTFIYTRSSR